METTNTDVIDADIEANVRTSDLASTQDGAYEIETLAKTTIPIYFSQPIVQRQFKEFRYRQAQQSNYFLSTWTLNFLHMVSLSRVIYYFGSSTEDIMESLTFVIVVGYTIGVVGFLLALCANLLKMKCVQKFVSSISSDIHFWRRYIIWVSLLCVCIDSGLHLISRVQFGKCRDNVPVSHCSHYENYPPIFQFVSGILFMLLNYIACKDLFGTPQLVISWFVTSSLLTASATIAGGDALYFRAPLLLCAGFLYLPFFLNYQDMLMFEYHWVLQKANKDRIDAVRARAETEKAQLQLVLANVAHDLKTPLQAFYAGVYSMKELFKAGPKNTRKHLENSCLSIMEDMDASYAFMMMQINRALDVSKSGSGLQLLPKPEPFKLNDVVVWAVSIISSIQATVSLKVVTEPSTLAEMSIITDKCWLQENFLCLMSNAVKYSPVDSCVTLRITLQKSDTGNSSILIEVEDQGSGVPLHLRNFLFRPNLQSQRRVGGTGLGLYSLALRTDALGGAYGMRPVRESGNETGCVFYFSFPYIEEASGQNKISTYVNPFSSVVNHAAVPSVQDQRHINRADADNACSLDITLSVLVVDDAATTVKVLSKSLSLAGFDVDTASDGLEALKKMKGRLYTAVIMDIQMPIMDGLQSVSLLRHWEKGLTGADCRHQFILGASASSHEDTCRDAIACGMDQFHLKPLNLKIIMAIVRDTQHAIIATAASSLEVAVQAV